ncbi:MAG: OmpA family protein, partial [Arcobacter sp.]|nr:OmpA family protein [Arcobacter sp.]
SFTVEGLNSNDKFKNDLDTFLPQLLKIIANNKESIQTINIKSFTSSEHRKFKEHYESLQANKELSVRRANKVKQYFVELSQNSKLDFNWFSRNITTDGMGSIDLVKTPTGNEDKDASRRIVIEIIKR